MGRLRNPICRGYYPATRRNLKEYGWYEHNQLHSYKNAFWLLKSINGDIFPLAEFKEHKIKFDYANLQFIKSSHLICVSVSSWGGGGEGKKKRWINSGQVEHKKKNLVIYHSLKGSRQGRHSNTEKVPMAQWWQQTTALQIPWEFIFPLQNLIGLERFLTWNLLIKLRRDETFSSSLPQGLKIMRTNIAWPSHIIF